jgi:type I restriction enzyme S subunit
MNTMKEAIFVAPNRTTGKFKQTEVGLIPEDWKVKHLINVGIIKGRVGWKGYTVKDLRTSGVYAIGAKHIDTKNKLDLSDPTFLSYEKFIESPEIIVKKNDVLIVQRGTIGKVVLIDREIGDATINPSMLIFRAKNIHSVYFYYYMVSNQGQRQLLGDTSSTGVPMITQRQVLGFCIPIPSLPEQTAIAKALSDADALIASLEKLIVKKKRIKQGAMQELLRPKEGWVKKTLGELGKCLRGVSYAMTDLHSNEISNTVRLLRSNNVKNDFIIWEDFQIVNQSRVKVDQVIQQYDILICMANGSKSLVGKSAFFSKPLSITHTFGAFMGVFRTESQNAHPYFVYLNLKSNNYRNYIDVLLSGSSINNLKPSDIESIQIYLPAFNEQLSISEIINDMENEILVLENRLLKATQLKQGMMQNLLTGKIRLV